MALTEQSGHPGSQERFQAPGASLDGQDRRQMLMIGDMLIQHGATDCEFCGGAILPGHKTCTACRTGDKKARIAPLDWLRSQGYMVYAASPKPQTGPQCSRCGRHVPGADPSCVVICPLCVAFGADRVKRGEFVSKRREDRTCPDCGGPLKFRQRVCETCRGKRKRKARRESMRRLRQLSRSGPVVS